jgi:hypothetical protein
MIALWHTIRQIYGKAAARGVANLVMQIQNDIPKPKWFRPTFSFAHLPSRWRLTAWWDQRSIEDE